MPESSPSQPSFAVSGNIVDLHAGRIHPGTVEVRGGRIARITRDGDRYETYLLPGFVDAHIHVESSMLPPSEFARVAVTHGTVATVSDPHEVANVLGVPGVRYMIDDGARVPFQFCVGAPSCVPATVFETAGAMLDAGAVAELLADPAVGYLSEVMNVRGVLDADPDLLAKLAAAKRLGKPIDGHAPGLRGDACRAYFAAGISTDHECFALDEAIEKIGLGVKILIREGSAARNFDALHPLLRDHADRCMLCSDDKHPNDLERGHINALVARAVAAGVPVMNALRAACVNPVEHYRLPTGLLREGDRADFIEVGDLSTFDVKRTWVGGQLVAADGAALLPRRTASTPNVFHASPKSPAEFAVPVRGGSVNVIEPADGQLVTRRRRERATIRDGRAIADPARDLLKIAVVNRYRAGAAPAVGFIRNVGLKRGAIASSVAHDSHNVVAVGATDEDLARAVNEVIRHRGGLAVATADSAESLPLPIAGLMSDLPAADVARRYATLDARAKELGCALAAPFMTLSFMALLVIPELKLSDKGLFDGVAWRFVDVSEESAPAVG
jgi:adenine deaminase